MAPPHLLTLPFEVRERIYLSLFTFHGAELQYETVSYCKVAYFDRQPRSAQLLRVCSQIKQEALLIFMERTLVVAPRHGPAPLEIRMRQISIHGVLPPILRIPRRHLEYHMDPDALLSNSCILQYEDLSSLLSLRVVCQSVSWTVPHRKAAYEESYHELRDLMRSYLSESNMFTHLADESVTGKRICFYLRQGPKITKKTKR